ncbi:MAG: hypothetical protein OXI76_06450 [Gemmatimonadota bacterium]|nr:hypothetical protein [Gemmatimonadota bacterium]
MVMWMAYGAGVACLLAAGALSLDKLCERVGFPRRFAWLAGLTLALLVPLTASPPEPEIGAETVARAGTTAADVAPRSIDPARAGGPIDRSVAGGEPVTAGNTAAAAPGPTDRAAITLWGFASLAALILIGTVLVAAALARRRWDRRRIAGEDVYVSRRFGPALVGVVKPAIVVPRWVLKYGDVAGATVVRHEREHARAWDHLTLLYSALVVAAMPWNPVVWWMVLRLRTAVEIDCDRRVLASGIPAAEYGDLLLDIGSGRPAQPFFATTLVGSQSMLERRLKAMRNQGIRVRKSAMLLFGCTAVVTTAVACGVPAPQGIAPAVKEALEAPAEVAAETPPSLPVDHEGRVVIRGVNKAPVVSLDADIVATDPLVLVDGFLLDGGLAELLAGEPLDIQWVGFSRDPELFPELGEESSIRGTVAIGTPDWEREGERAVSLDVWRRTNNELGEFRISTWPAGVKLELIRNPAKRVQLTRNPAQRLQLTRNPVKWLQLELTPTQRLQLIRNPAPRLHLTRNPGKRLQLTRSPVRRLQIPRLRLTKSGALRI